MQGLSRKSSAYFKSVLAKYSQVAVLGKLLKKINIVPDSIACHQQGIDWVVPLSSFSDTNLLESTILVVEHMYDYQVILFLAQIHLREKGIFGMGGLGLPRFLVEGWHFAYISRPSAKFEFLRALCRRLGSPSRAWCAW
ncbi:hypothetical protein N8D55_04180 [Xanthomonas hortorum pv. pelargonii]|nr:hypothetical protein N8D55_04180 [Xanthomonas hortorum pv. pelargonii]